MKSIFKYMAILAAGIGLAACSPEEFEGASGNVPQASDYADNFTVTVDQSTNNATFEFISAPGVTPVWIIDGAYSTAYSFTRFYRKAGTYSVECKLRRLRPGERLQPVQGRHLRRTFLLLRPGLGTDSQPVVHVHRRHVHAVPAHGHHGALAGADAGGNGCGHYCRQDV